MNKKDNMRFQERILWFEGVETNNFTVDISGMVPQDCYDLDVKLSVCYISYSDTNIFDALLIRILGDFGVGHNQFSSPNTYIQLGMINNPLTRINSSLELIEPNSMPRYSLTQTPNLINFIIANEFCENLVTLNSGIPQSYVNICLTFSYYI